ncbi:hypothetical protein FQP90_21685 [Paenarthrobacter nitroguajacolicus]|uniref:ESX secretion-associated protein EspG n=1 Tax=Paenarthrobacter nitroguajacolicus TaxID=211146 RepID=A0A558GMY3_PAENT|nr:hypothetical protein [Paenarthrobacter nitroguajacolicus]TVU58251.1 hypothetical protein FQP90_21685 [Paenarthrobacter nitroguajacolicus]
MTTSTMKWTQRDIEAAAKVLASASAVGAPLPTLTDEEVVALDGVQHEQLVALPWLSAQDASKELMCAIALRGLLAKELVYPVVFEGETEPSRLHATEDITGALTLRRSGSSVVSVERTVSTGKRWLYGYVHDDGVLLEEVDESGLHGFTVVTREQLVPRLADFVDPEKAAAKDTDPTVYTEAQFEDRAATVLADTQAASNVVAFNSDTNDFPTVTVYTGPSSVHVLTPQVTGESVKLELKETSAASLAGVLGGLAGLA